MRRPLSSHGLTDPPSRCWGRSDASPAAHGSDVVRPSPDRPIMKVGGEHRHARGHDQNPRNQSGIPKERVHHGCDLPLQLDRRYTRLLGLPV